MAGRYIKIKSEKFIELMDENLFVHINAQKPNEEMIFGYTWYNTYQIKIYSSIVAGNGARPKGTDAIRIVLRVRYRKDNEIEVMTGWKAKVLRTKNWRINLQKRIDEALLHGCEGTDWQCPECGQAMVLRTNKNDTKFYGCIMYPINKCYGTKKYE